MILILWKIISQWFLPCAGRMPFNFGLSDLLSWLDSGFESLAGISQKRRCVLCARYQAAHDFNLSHYWCCLITLIMFTKLLRRNVTQEIIPFPSAVIEYFCGEVFWNDINILFPINFSLPPPSFPSSLVGLMISPFLPYTIICYYPYLFWCSECSRSDTVTSVSLGYISIFKYFLTFQNNRLILFFLGLRNKLFLQWALDSFRSQDRGIWGAHCYWGVMSSRSSQWRELKDIYLQNYWNHPTPSNATPTPNSSFYISFHICDFLVQRWATWLPLSWIYLRIWYIYLQYPVMAPVPSCVWMPFSPFLCSLTPCWASPPHGQHLLNWSS